MLGLDGESDEDEADAASSRQTAAPASLLGQGARGLLKGLGAIGR